MLPLPTDVDVDFVSVGCAVECGRDDGRAGGLFARSLDPAIRKVSVPVVVGLARLCLMSDQGAILFALTEKLFGG